MQPRFSNLIKLFGFGVLKNGIKYDFPFRESLLSMKPITESVYFALGDSVDSTNAEFEKYSFCKTIHTTWDKSLKDGKVISVETNKALSFLKESVGDLAHSWGLYLQADEVLHEDDYDLLLKDLEYCEQNGYDALSFRYLHFWQTHHHVAISKNWYPHEIRAIKLDSPIVSWGDGQSFEKAQKVFFTEARIFHYGHVREQKAYAEKMRFQSSFHHADHLVEEKLKKDAKNSKKHKTVYYFGSHPSVMKERILRMNDIWQLDEKKIVYIVGNPEKYSPHIRSSIAAEKVIWCKNTNEVPSVEKKNMIIAEPTILDQFLKRSTTPKKMKSKHGLEWSADFRFILQVSEKGVGFKAHA